MFLRDPSLFIALDASDVGNLRQQQIKLERNVNTKRIWFFFFKKKCFVTFTGVCNPSPDSIQSLP
jgi:hypothetical protein